MKSGSERLEVVDEIDEMAAIIPTTHHHGRDPVDSHAARLPSRCVLEYAIFSFG